MLVQKTQQLIHTQSDHYLLQRAHYTHTKGGNYARNNQGFLCSLVNKLTTIPDYAHTSLFVYISKLVQQFILVNTKLRLLTI